MPRRLRPAAPDPEALRLGLAKLKESGLDRKDADRLALRFLAGPETQRLSPTFKALPAILLPYHDPRRPGEPLRVRPGRPGFFRLRYLKRVKSFGEQKDWRYTQPPDSGVAAYFPPSIAWGGILMDPTHPLIITEGELKAACACKKGFPTIGLGGVSSWRSPSLGRLLLKELEEVDWRERTTYLIFDSDLKRNPQVCLALQGLADQLSQRGALPQLVSLPDLPNLAKVGLDDFLVRCGAKQLRSLFQDAAEPLTLAEPLWQLNRQVVYARDPGLVVEIKTRRKIAPASFRDHAYAAQTVVERELRADGRVSLKPASAAAAWLKWPMRREVGGLTYQPGKPRLTNQNGSVHSSRWNLWPGWGVDAARGDVKPFIQLLDHLFMDAEPEARAWFERWCAFPLQHPGTKMFSATVFFGTRHGTGKSLIGYTLGKIYGENFAEIRQSDLTGGFNEWAEAKQLVLGDDISGSTRRQDADLLKKLITQKQLRVNAKYIPSYVVPDTINYFFTSNQPDSFFLEDDDRRFFIHEVTVAPLAESFYRRYDAWLKGPGASYVFRYLLDLDLGQFNPFGPAFKTRARDLMIADVKSDLGAWVQDLRLHPDESLRVGEVPLSGDLWSSRQLLDLYDPEGKTGTTANGLARELRRAGFPVVAKGQPLTGTDGRPGRFFAVRRLDLWRRADAVKAQSHLNHVAETLKPKAHKF